ncbi:MAG: hypothetical protein QOI01_5834 [Mycobacterium sp.]|nr:hypothetical protein [Mycobacterium sp.]
MEPTLGIISLANVPVTRQHRATTRNNSSSLLSVHSADKGPVQQVTIVNGSADPFIHEADVAAVLAAALLDHRLAGQKISITGPEPVTHTEMVTTIGAVIGRSLRYEEISPARAADDIVALGLPRSFAEAMMARYSRDLDRPTPATDGVKKTLGRPAHTYAEWVFDHATAFRNLPAATQPS